MEIRVIFKNVMFQYDSSVSCKEREFVSQIDASTTLSQLFESAEEWFADLSEYYYLSGVFSFNTPCIPYVIDSNGIVKWDVLFQDTKVADFVSTHKIENGTIIAKVGYVQAGGPGFIELAEIWSLIYPIIEQFVTLIGLSTIVGGAGKWVHSLLKKKAVPPQSYFDLIFSRQQWNHFEFAKKLEIEPDKAKQLLKIFGYKYCSSEMSYIQQENSLALREKLSQINVLDINNNN